MLNMREKSEMHSHLAANMCKLEQSVPNRSVESEPENIFCPTLYHQADALDGYFLKSLKLPIDQLPQGCSHLQELLSNLAQVRRLESMFNLLHVAYLQLNGKMYMPEIEKMNVNCLVKYLQVKT